MEQHIFQYVDLEDITEIKNSIIINPNIDFYTLGVYIKLKYFSEHSINLDTLLNYGSSNYIERALNKLKQENYIKGDFSWDTK